MHAEPPSHDHPSILFVSRTWPVLTGPRDVPEGRVWRYGIGFPFQISADRAAMLCNIRSEGCGMADTEVGVDAVVFDRLDGIRAEAAVPLLREETRCDADTGEDLVVLKYPMAGGFVPLGAKRADGTPHPGAGTGFGLNVALTYPASRFAPVLAKHESPRVGRRSWVCELRQLSTDGVGLRAGPVQYLDGEGVGKALCPCCIGMSMAVPDGDDLLFAGGATPPGPIDPDERVFGISRWRYDGRAWGPVSFQSVGEPTWCEPSLARDRDGSLLYTSRSYRTGLVAHIVVWRSRDGGESWERLIHFDADRLESPLSINGAANGTPYVVSNARIARNVWGYSRELREKGGNQKFGRVKLVAWELNPERTGLLHPRTVRDFSDSPDFFLPPESSYWRADHPIGAVLKLADGEWHSVLAYRVFFREAHDSSGSPKPQTGLHLEELITSGKTIAPWQF